MIPYRSALDSLHDYVPGKSIDEIRERHGLAEVIKLASNENPLGPSPKAIEALAQSAQNLHLYPRGECPQLRTALSHYLGIPESRLVLGNGSDEILAFIAMAFLEKGSKALSCQPTFSVYESVTLAMGAVFDALPLRDWLFDLDALLKAITPEVRVIFICNPNNPTGTWIDRAKMGQFLQKVPADVLVVVDQAYCEYAEDAEYPDLRGELSRFPNLLLIRTFSKIWGLAGMRIGYAMGQEELIEKLWKVKPPFNVNLPAQACAVAALADSRHYQESLRVNREGMIQLKEGLKSLDLLVLPSQANFLAVRVGPQCPELVAWLESHGMIVRSLRSFGLPDWLRVTVGLVDQNRRFLQLVNEAKIQRVFQ